MTNPRLYRERLFEVGRRFSPPAGRRELLRARVLRQAAGGALVSASGMALPLASAAGLPLKAWFVVATSLVVGAASGIAIVFETTEAVRPVAASASLQTAGSRVAGPTPELAHSVATSPRQHGERLRAQKIAGSELDKARPARLKVEARTADQVESPPRLDAARELALELELLRSAQRALSSGSPAAAFDLLEDHAARFPATRLVQERRAARVLALCGLNRKEQAEREARAFLGDFPKSPLAARVERACAPRR